MALLTSVVVALAAALGLNFVLTLGVLRRLRMLNTGQPTGQSVGLPHVGDQFPPLVIDSTDGRRIDSTFFDRGPVIVGFFVRGCDACERVKASLQRSVLHEPLLALVRAADPPEPEDVEVFASLAAVGAIVAPFTQGSGLMEHFSVSAFPTLIRVQDGVIASAGLRLRDVLEADHHRGGSRSRFRLSAAERGIG